MKKLFYFILVSLLGLGNAYAVDAFVSTTGNDENDGKSWAQAKATIASAMTVSGITDGTIHVAAGTYNISSAIVFSKSFNIFGGYLVDDETGTATRPLIPGGKPWEFEHETILNAVLGVTGTNTDNKNSKIIHIGTGAYTLEINGITFQNANGKHSSSNELGGAIGGSTPKTAGTQDITIRYCKFLNNGVTKKDYDYGGMGGAIWLKSKALIDQCYFSGNYADSGSGGGGAIFSQPNFAEELITINSCMFDGNTSNVGGGGVRTNGAFKTIIKSCIFANNVTKDGDWKNGAAINCNGASSGSESIDEIENCLFYNNAGSTAVSFRGTTIKNCSFVNNTGTIRIAGTTTQLYNTVIWGNKQTSGTQAAIEYNQMPAVIKYCAAETIHADYTAPDNHNLILNTSNTAVDGPNFKTPTSFVGNGDLSGETPDWSITSASPFKETGDPANATATDITGRTRSVTKPSIGAYEWDGITTVLGNNTSNLLYTVQNNILYISHDAEISVKVLSVSGQTVAYSSSAFNHAIPLQSGVYVVLVSGKNGKSDAFKVIAK